MWQIDDMLVDDGCFMLIGFDELIRVDADHQIVASLFGMVLQIQVPDMKHVEDALCVADMVMFGHRLLQKTTLCRSMGYSITR